MENKEKLVSWDWLSREDKIKKIFEFYNDKKKMWDKEIDFIYELIYPNQPTTS